MALTVRKLCRALVCFAGYWQHVWYLPASEKVLRDKGLLAKDSALFVLKTNAQEKRSLLKRLNMDLEYKLRNKAKLQKEFDTNLIFRYPLL